jgi:hypothetical protein
MQQAHNQLTTDFWFFCCCSRAHHHTLALAHDTRSSSETSKPPPTVDKILNVWYRIICRRVGGGVLDVTPKDHTKKGTGPSSHYSGAQAKSFTCHKRASNSLDEPSTMSSPDTFTSLQENKRRGVSAQRGSRD